MRSAYKAPPPEASTEAFYETDPTKDYRRGFALQCVSPLPIVFAEHVSAQGHWGVTLREYMRDYVHWATFGALCEFLPQARQPGDAGRRDGPARAFRWPTSPIRWCDNDRRPGRGGDAGS